MKNKPLRHKEENKFKFLPFAERISGIDVDIFHRVGHQNEEDSEDPATFFQQAIEKWNVLNLTDNYSTLRRELPIVQTLPQLLNKKEDAIDTLLKNLNNENTLALQPTLELVVALARDLRQEFYPYYSKFIQRLIDLLKTRDTDQLEWTFTCLAYLFKFLWRCLVKDVGIVFDSLLPLLAGNKPSYINNFAAESFAFVARKVKDKKSFLALVLETLKTRPGSEKGCGQLLFEVIRGVTGQFHSSADVVLPLYLNALADESFPQDLLFEVLTHTFDGLLTFIHRQKCTVLWTSLLKTLSSFTSIWEKDVSERNANNIFLITKLIHQAVTFKDARFVTDPVSVIQQLLVLVKSKDLPESVVHVVSEIGAVILLSSQAKLPQEHANRIMIALLAVPYPSILKKFVVQVLDYSGFEVLVLPFILRHCNEKVSNTIPNEILELLTRLVIHKVPPCNSGMDLEGWQRYPLDFPSAVIPNVVLKMLAIPKVNSLLKNTEDSLCSLIILPHLKPIDRVSTASNLKNIVYALCKDLNNAKNNDETLDQSEMKSATEERTEKIIFLVVHAIEALVHLTDSESLFELCEFDFIVGTLLPYASKTNHIGCLRALDIFVTACNVRERDETFCEDALVTLHDGLSTNLSSPFHKIRLLTAHLFSLFERLPDGESTRSMFSLCLAAELAPSTITEYRDKLKHLNNLEFGISELSLANSSHYNKVPLQYLLGILYVNFQLLWEPVSLLIASHAHGMATNEFWEVFFSQLQVAARFATSETNEIPTPNISAEFLEDLYVTSMRTSDDRPDHVNYRILLWKSMLHFPNLCAKKTRDISPMFFSFLETEYFKSDAGTALSWNIKLYDKEDADETKDDSEPMEVDESNADAEVAAIKKKLLQKPPKTSKKLGAKTGKMLSAHLSIFAKFKDPNSVFRAPELKQLYHDFLSSKSPEVQKLALDCLMTYKHQFMIPYREHLYGLIDDRTFKSELIKFKIDAESELIQESHRAELIPIILRIAYSKMMAKMPSQRGRVSAVEMKRSIVLRFLSGCHEDELMIFIKMAFKMYTQSIQDDILQMVDSIMSNIDLEKVLPPKRLQSSMNLLSVMLNQFGGLMGRQLLSYLLRVLLCIGANVVGMLEQREMIHVGYIHILRSVRTQCLETTTLFFKRFNKFDWSSDEIDAMFRVLVFPRVEYLSTEGIYSPTALLKLFVVWSEDPRYFQLLAKHDPNDVNITPLPHIMRLLQNERLHPSVVATIIELVERLMTLSDFDPTARDEDNADVDPAKPLSVTYVLPVDQEAISKLSLTENINYGSSLLLSHIDPILERLKRKLFVKGKSLSYRELVVLSRASELVWESETSDTLLKLLLPMMLKKSGAGDEVVVPLIVTLTNLVKNLDDSEKYILNLAPLFGQVSGTVPRRMLSALMAMIASKCSVEKSASLADSLGLVGELNACDRKWIDQPDYNRRLDAFKRVNGMIDAKSVDFELGIIVIHTCFHYLKNETDLSLRDSAGYCLRRLAPALCLQYESDKGLRNTLIETTILRLVRQGIQDKTDKLYLEAIGLLGAMARECPKSHTVFRDLSVYTNKEDPEVDFFENLQHLQGHRKARALNKFCQISRTLVKAPNPRTLSQLILPIASKFLMSEKYSHKHVMVDAAVEAVGTVCRLLPWHQYDLILRFYLDKLKTVLEYQKQLVRIIIAILDAFHFDLSRAKEAMDVVQCTIGNQYVEALSVEVPQENEEFVLDESKAVDVSGDDEKPANKSGIEQHLELIAELETALNDDDAEETNVPAEEGETVPVRKVQTVPAAERQTVLTPPGAVRARNGITKELLPQLHACIAQRSSMDGKHKLNRRQGGDDRDEEDILRVPIALASVKLLQQLPKEILEQNLPGIFMKLCSFLKSRLESVRRVTRQTLMKIMLSLGPDYLAYLINEMCSLLTRGYQVHVLVYTIHSVIVSLKDLFRPGDADSCLRDVLECCKMDLFGPTAEEKKIAGIIAKVQEARSTKSFDTYQHMARFITDKCLTDLLLPIQQILLRSSSMKSVQKCSECLRNIVIGLSTNKFIPVESLLIFMYGTISESIPELAPKKAEPVSAAKRELLARQRPDTFLIPKAPRGRYGAITITAQTVACTNAHVIVEFGLKLLQTLLKREKLRSHEYKQFIDPVVPIIIGCLDAKHIKLTTLSLKNLTPMFKMELPTLQENMTKVVSSLFAILHKFAAAGLTKGENFDLVAAVFKAVLVVVRDVQWYTISEEQLKALLLYAEQDLHDVSRQATAFSLLRAILARKLLTPEIHNVMHKVAVMSVTSRSGSVQMQGRQVFHQYLMDYPIGKRLDKHLGFFLAQLDYDLQSGRESTLEMLHTIITTFPDNVLSKKSGLFFVTLGARLVNDDVPQCRKMVARCLQTMLQRLTNEDRNKLFDIATLWLADKKVGHRKLAAQLCGIFVLVEKEAFEKRLVDFLPQVISQFGRGYDDERPGKFVRVVKTAELGLTARLDRFADVQIENAERLSDHHMFQVLQMILKMCEHCPKFFKGSDWQEFVNVIAENAQSMLAHPHEWVRLASAQYLGHVFASLEPEKVAAVAYSKTSKRTYLSSNTAHKLKSLVLDHCAQLHPEIAPQLAAQVVKNLVFLGQILKSVPAGPTNVASNEKKEESDDDDELAESPNVSLAWMIRRMRKLVNMEVVQTPHSTIMRTSVFQWIGAVVIDLTKTDLIPQLYNLLAPLAREITSEDEMNPEMHRMAINVAKQIKNKVGMEEYTRQLAILEQRIASRRADRKKIRTREAITQPELFAKRKIEKQLKKKDAKKRKIDMFKGRKITPKKKRVRKESE